MAKDTVTLALNGKPITLEEFARGVTAFARLVEAMTEHVAKKAGIQWNLDDLSIGSATATARGVEYGGAGYVPRVIKAVQDAGQSVRRSGKSGVSKKVDKQFSELRKLLNGRIRSIRLETEEEDVEILATKATIKDEAVVSIGAIRGRVQTLTETRGLRFTLYESTNNRPVSCYLVAGSEEQMREVWGRMAIVEGEVRRDPVMGYPTTIRHVRKILRVGEDTGLYSEAVGCFSPPEDFAKPEETIRELRDGWR